MSQYLITITRPLTPSQTQRLIRAAHADATIESPFIHAFVCAGSDSQYAPAYGEVDPHAVARQMMTVAGTTFEYTVERLDA